MEASRFSMHRKIQANSDIKEDHGVRVLGLLRIILVEFMKLGTTINGAAYRNILNNLRKVIKQKRPGLLTTGV